MMILCEVMSGCKKGREDRVEETSALKEVMERLAVYTSTLNCGKDDYFVQMMIFCEVMSCCMKGKDDRVEETSVLKEVMERLAVIQVHEIAVKTTILSK